MSNRDELADILMSDTLFDSSLYGRDYALGEADAILEAGYRKPRIIEDVGSRDALPDGAVVMSSAGTMACKFDSSRGVMFGMSLPFPWKNLALPLTVLWEPLP